jgi:hypothetical protein
MVAFSSFWASWTPAPRHDMTHDSERESAAPKNSNILAVRSDMLLSVVSKRSRTDVERRLHARVCMYSCMYVRAHWGVNVARRASHQPLLFPCTSVSSCNTQ